MFIVTRTRKFIEDNLLFTLLLLTTGVFVFFGGFALFLQAQRAGLGEPLAENWKAWFIIGCYGALGLISLILIGRRARILTLRLRRIPQKEETAPLVVRQFMQDEYWRTAAIAYVSQPRRRRQEGWGTPGTAYESIKFRRAMLDTVPIIDAQARIVAPRLPALRPHIRIGQHLRGLAALFPSDRLSCLYEYDSLVLLARYAEREPTQAEFERGMKAYQELYDILAIYRYG